MRAPVMSVLEVLGQEPFEMWLNRRPAQLHACKNSMLSHRLAEPFSDTCPVRIELRGE